MTVAAHKARYSIVAPVFNEQAILETLYQRVTTVMVTLGEPYELVLINDGSTDRSLELMRSLREQDKRLKIINFSRNFGHQTAITAGLDYAEGDAVIIIDADLQDPPEVILQLIEKWKEGFEVVYAMRESRRGETRFKEFTAKLFYRLMTRITDVEIPQDTGDFRLTDRKVVQAMRQLRERHRFMRGLSVWTGFRQTGVRYVRAERYAGETKYPLRKMLRFALDGITSFSYLPLQIATYLGFAIATFSLIAIIAVVFLRLNGRHALLGQATTLVSVLFLGGIQLIFLGIIGEYLGRIYDEVKGRPLYVVSDTWGFDGVAADQRHDDANRGR